MIRLLKEGIYRLLETRNDTKILTLDAKETFAWITATGIGEILVTTHQAIPTDTILSLGNYRLYEVKDEPDLTDLRHLELHAGNGTWQGYLLPLGLPTTKEKRHRIIPTDEIITKPH